MLVILIGYRGTGKTTLAELLAERLGCGWFDADAEVQRQADKTIKQIFADDGEETFRDLETAVIAELAKHSSAVLALGGGAVMRGENRQAIAGGTTIWLRASPQTIHERVLADQMTSQQRPDLTALGGRAEIEQLLTQREPFYRGCADFIVETDGRTTDDIAREIVCLVQGEAAS